MHPVYPLNVLLQPWEEAGEPHTPSHSSNDQDYSSDTIQWQSSPSNQEPNSDNDPEQNFDNKQEQKVHNQLTIRQKMSIENLVNPSVHAVQPAAGNNFAMPANRSVADRMNAALGLFTLSTGRCLLPSPTPAPRASTHTKTQGHESQIRSPMPASTSSTRVDAQGHEVQFDNPAPAASPWTHVNKQGHESQVEPVSSSSSSPPDSSTTERRPSRSQTKYKPDRLSDLNVRKRQKVTGGEDSQELTGIKNANYNTPQYRFAKNISFWLDAVRKSAPSKNVWDWTTIEDRVEDLLPRKNNNLNIPNNFDFSASNLVPSKTSSSPSVPEDKCKFGLHDTEKELCRHLNIRFDKYRVIRAALLAGFACIYEQNLRGTSRTVCINHPAVTQPAGNYRCINAGRAQAQLMVPGVDANVSSNVFKIQEAWGWYPMQFLRKGQAELSEEVEKRFPRYVRKQLMQEYEDWQGESIKDVSLRMIITSQNCSKDLSKRKCVNLQCPCSGKVANFTLPQGSGDDRSQSRKRQLETST